MFGVQPKNRKTANDLILMLRLNEATTKMTTANSVRLCGHEGVDARVMRKALDFGVKGRKRQKG